MQLDRAGALPTPDHPLFTTHCSLAAPDLMSLDHNPKFWQVLGQNMLGLTPNEALKLQKKCLQKHPE